MLFSKPSRPLARRVVLAAFLLGCSIPASAQPDAVSSSGDAPLFVESTDVVLVNVDVWVTTRDGRPITGLDADDFLVLEDGEPVEVSHFAELREGHRVVETPAASTPETTDDAAADARSVQLREDLGHLIVYVDEIHLAPRSRRAAFDALRAFLADGKMPAHRISIVRQDDDLVTVAPFGSTEASLTQALDDLEQRSTGAREIHRQRQRLMAEIQRIYEDARVTPASSDSPCLTTRRRSQPMIDQHALESATRVVGTLGHLWSTADYLAGLPGNKALVYLGEGLEMMPGAAHRRFLEELCVVSEADAHDALPGYALVERYRAFTRHANSARITVHTLDAGGLRPSGGFDLETGTSTRPGATTAFHRAAKSDLQSGLNIMADDTGGRAVFQRNDLGPALDDIARDLGTRYSLAYRPPHGGDGGRHSIEVELREPIRGATLRHRRDYRDRSADERLAAQVRTALFAGFVENPLDARFGWGEGREGAEGRIIVPLRVNVPVDGLVFLPRDGVETAHVTLLAAARDADGDMVSFTERKPVLERPPEGMAAYPLRIDVEMPPGQHVVAVAVRDDVGRRTSVLAAPITLGRTDATAD